MDWHLRLTMVRQGRQHYGKGAPTSSTQRYAGVGHGFGLGIGTSAEGWIADAIQFWAKQINAGPPCRDLERGWVRRRREYRALKATVMYGVDHVRVEEVGRAGTPDEVGYVGAMLMGPDGAFITGERRPHGRRRHGCLLVWRARLGNNYLRNNHG